MANKLTKEKLDLLIEQVLQEKTINVNLPPTAPFNIDTSRQADRKKVSTGLAAQKYEDDVEDLAGLDGEKTDLSANDLLAAFRGKNSSADYKTANQIATDGTGKLKKTAIAIKNSADAGELNPKKSKTVGNFYKAQSIASAALANIGSEDGQYPEGISTAMYVAFRGMNTLTERINQLKKFAEEINDDKAIAKYTPKKLIANTIVLDYFRTLCKEMESGSGAYQFENFLAAISGGKVTGKQDTAGGGRAGKMGAVDFTTNIGSRGSAKFYSAADTSVKQSKNGFNNMKNEPVIYILAHKKSTKGTAISYQTANPTDIVAINVYITVVIPLVDSPSVEEDFLVMPMGGEAQIGKFDGSNLVVGGRGISVSPIEILLVYDKSGSTSKSLREKLSNAAENSIEKSAEALKYFMDSMDNLKKSDEKIKAYSTGGVISVGDDALKALDSVDDNFVKLVEIISNQKSVKGARGDRKIKNENQTKSLKDLDKLIERVIIESMNKK